MGEEITIGVPEAPACSPADELAKLASLIRRCRNCDLVLGRHHAVPGEGHPRATMMFVGEGPGATEDETGRPFVGAAGHFLDELLADIGLRREDVFIANVTKCRPPGNRDPLPEEIDACHPWLRAQIRIIQPRVICTLGRFAMHALIDPQLQISKVHGTPVVRNGILFVPLFHPAAALHQQSLRNTLIADMRQVREILRERGLWEGV